MEVDVVDEEVTLSCPYTPCVSCGQDYTIGESDAAKGSSFCSVDCERTHFQVNDEDIHFAGPCMADDWRGIK
jgi:hypothetical protein